MIYTSNDIIEEPDAVIPHVRICMGAVRVTGRSTMTIPKGKNMRLLLLLIPLFLSSCATAPTGGYSDEEYAQLLIGTWSGQYSFDDGAEISYGEKIYRHNGTAVGFISYRVRLPSGKYSEIDYVSYESKWRIENGIVVITEAIYNPLEPGSEKEVVRDRIVSLGSNKAVFEDLDDSSKFERFRKNRTQVIN